MLREKRAWKKLVVFLLVEPGAFDIEEFQARHADGERERIDRQLRDRLIRARIRFVIENVHGIVAHLQNVEVARDAARRPTRREFNAVARFEFADLVFGEPDGNLDGDRARVIREHKILQRLVSQFVAADGGDDQRRGLGRRVLFAIDDEAIDIGKRRLCLRSAGFRIVFAAKQLVRARARNLLKKGRERFKALMLRIAAQECELRSVIGEGVDLGVIELDGADRLRRRIDRLGFGAKAAKGGLLFMRADPGCDRGWRDGAAGFGIQALGSFAERVA